VDRKICPLLFVALDWRSNMDQKMLLPHLQDVARRAKQLDKPQTSSFLNPAEATLAAQSFANRKEIRMILDGGFEGAERVVPVFLPGGENEYDREAVLRAIELTFRKQDSLGHRDILGAALGLGLDRKVLGDIVMEPGRAVLICLCGVAPLLLEELRLAGRVGLTSRALPLTQLPAENNNFLELRGTVPSLRLDAVLAETFRCSRSAAEELLRAGLVQLRHEECRDGTKPVRQDDIISVRGKGRVRILELGNKTKKDRFFLTFARFARLP
jgi:RNA-binding protein YlmH